MHLKFSRINNDSYIVESTEVFFADHESSLKEKLLEVLPASGLEYDKEVFPEQIILNGLHSKRRVNQLFLDKKSLMKPFGHLARIMPDITIHEIRVSEKYL